MSHRKGDLGIPCREKSAKVVLGRVLINRPDCPEERRNKQTLKNRGSVPGRDLVFGGVNSACCHTMNAAVMPRIERAGRGSDNTVHAVHEPDCGHAVSSLCQPAEQLPRWCLFPSW